MAKTSWIDRTKMKLKVSVPMGVTLTSGESLALAEVYREDAKRLRESEKEVTTALSSTAKVDAFNVDTALAARNMAISTFKRTKNPIKRREWARRVVVAEETLGTLRKVRKRMTATHDRLTMIHGDLQLQIVQQEALAAEAEAYAKAGKQLRLVGDNLVSARTRVKGLKFEYDNLEVTMEGAEKQISSDKPDRVLRQAEKIAGIDSSH